MIKIVISLFMIILFPVIVTAGTASTFDLPDTAYASNVVIDLLEADGIIWLATDDGLNFSLDSGKTWLLYNKDNGLVSESVSAMLFVDGRIYVATNHSEIISDNLTSLSDGISYSDDLGDNWQVVDFDAQDIIYATGGDRTIFDLTGHGSWVFAAAFAGGLLASNDDATSWFRMFPTPRDSINYYEGHVGLDTLSLLNRYFSAQVDTSHFNPATPYDDSLFLWVGSAGGLVQFVFVDPHAKPFTKRISKIVTCENCSGEDVGYMFLGGDNGITRGFKNGAPYISIFDENEISYRQTTAIGYFADRLFLGTVDETGTNSALSISDDQGVSFTGVANFPADPQGETVFSEFDLFQDKLFLSASSGLFMSLDSGDTWQSFLIDTLNATSVVNTAYDFVSIGDTMYLGTDAGLAIVYLSDTTTVDSFIVKSFPETESSSTKITRLKIQEFADSLILWTIHEPVSAGAGTRFVGRNNIDRLDNIADWQHLQVDVVVTDMNFLGDTAFVVGEEGIRLTSFGTNPDIIFTIEMLIDSTVIDSLGSDTINVLSIQGDTIIVGTSNGFAYSNDRGETYNIVRINTDLTQHDASIHFTIANSFLNFSGGLGITGNWIPALEVQPIPGQADAIWLSTRSTGLEADTSGFGITRGMPFYNIGTDTLHQRYWQLFYEDDFAWNFAFNGDTVFAATNSGLIMNATGEQYEWDTLAFVDDLGEVQIFDEVPVYGVEVFDGFVWVGTDDRTLKLRLNDLVVEKTFYVEDNLTSVEEVYAFPVPFSHETDYEIDFHFTVEQDARVTLEIYDFAMNLVKRVLNNREYVAGIYPTSGSNRVTWDGFNGKGDKVAVGVYYFKVEYSTGEVRWGKLAVIP